MTLEKKQLHSKWEAQGDNEIKIMYGSMDLNAYTFVPIREGF